MNLKWIREYLGYELRDIAHATSTSTEELILIESGMRRPTDKLLARLRELYKCDIEYFASLINEKANKIGDKLELYYFAQYLKARK